MQGIFICVPVISLKLIPFLCLKSKNLFPVLIVFFLTCWAPFAYKCVAPCPFLKPLVETSHLAYSSSYNLTPAISQVLIGQHSISCLPTWPTCGNSPRKCTPVEYKARQKAGFPVVHTQPLSEYFESKS